MRQKVTVRANIERLVGVLVTYYIARVGEGISQLLVAVTHPEFWKPRCDFTNYFAKRLDSGTALKSYRLILRM